MKKTLTILWHEYHSGLRRPSFWLVTVLIPILLVAIYTIPVVSANRHSERTRVLVVDQSGLFSNSLPSTIEVAFVPMPSMDYARQKSEKNDLILLVAARETLIPTDAFLYYNGLAPSVNVQQTILSTLNNQLHNIIMEDVFNLDQGQRRSLNNANIMLHIRDKATGGDAFIEVRQHLAIVLSALILLTLVIFTMYVMRVVQKERQNRVAEIMLCSTSAASMMAGKVGGVMLLALTQLILWFFLTAGGIAIVHALNSDLFALVNEQGQAHRLVTKGAAATTQVNTPIMLVDETVRGLAAIDGSTIVMLFVIMFILGYMLYGTCIAALSSRLDSDAEVLPWTLLVASPMILPLLLSPIIVVNPNGLLALILTLLPPTAPTTLMLRIPFGIPLWQVVVSVVLTIATIIPLVRLSGRIYRKHLLSQN